MTQPFAIPDYSTQNRHLRQHLTGAYDMYLFFSVNAKPKTVGSSIESDPPADDATHESSKSFFRRCR